jgi:prevent-host-death family protein
VPGIGDAIGEGAGGGGVTAGEGGDAALDGDDGGVAAGGAVSPPAEPVGLQAARRIATRVKWCARLMELRCNSFVTGETGSVSVPVADVLRYLMPTIPQRDLRNRSGEILRQAERGTSFVVTVDGRPVAQLGPLPRRQWVSRTELERVLREAPFDPTLSADLSKQEDQLDVRHDPWTRRRK